MKKLYQILSKVVIVMLVTLIPIVTFAQAEKKEKTKGSNKAPTHSYWSVTLYGGANQFNGDLSKNLWINDKWTFGGGAYISKQFTRVMGLRVGLGYLQLKSEVDKKWVGDAYISQSFKTNVITTDIHTTINFINWFMGYKPERFFTSYLIVGIGSDHSKGVKKDLLLDQDIAYVGYKDRKGIDNKGVGNNSGLNGENLEFKAVGGLGFDFNISKHWSINPEFLWRWRDGDVADLTNGGAKEIKNDMYSSFNLGLTYKFAYSGCGVKEMSDPVMYEKVKYETTPAVLQEKGDSVQVTIKGTFPPKYFCEKAAMYFEPVVKYEGGTYTLPPMLLKGEKALGDGTVIKYKEGGSFTYTTVFPYRPEMANSELSVAPIVYEVKDKVITKKDEIKVKAKYAELPSRFLAPGIINTPTKIKLDMIPILADHGYIRDIIVSKTGIIYFKVNMYNLDLKFGINKTQPAMDALAQLNTFVKQGWKIKDITINGWASPEGEETFNANLSQNRAKTGNTYMIDQFKGWVKEAEKDNKDKKAVKEKVEAAGKDVNFVVQSHGPDWNGFLKNVQASTVKDKDKIMNVINSAGDNKKKEQEIRNMIVIYPEIEEKLLPPLRRAEITANLYEPSKTDEEISRLALSNPDQLKVEEILYAGTLTTNPDTKLAIYENAAKVYPDNWKALNNAADANIQKGNLDKASVYLQKAAALAPNNGAVENNIGCVAAMNKDYKKAEAQFKKAQQLGENENYNLGVLMIPKGDYAKANQMLSNAKCTYNLGLSQLVSGNVSAAQTTFGCAPQTPETFYMLAVCGARTNNTKLMYDNLMKAVADPKLKEQAKTDREFYNYQNTPDFKNIVK